MWWMSAATLPVPISPLPQQSPELCFLLPPKLVLWGILTHFPRKGTGQSGNSPALPINRGCSPGHWEWLGNEHVTQLMPMKCQDRFAGEELLGKILSQSFQEPLEGMLLSFWAEGWATISPGTPTAPLPLREPA